MVSGLLKSFRQSRFSLTFRLVTGVLVINLFAWFLTAVSLFQSLKECEERALVSAQNLSHLLEHDLAGLFRTVDISLRAVADEFHREQGRDGSINRAEFNRFLSRLHARIPELEGIRVADARGVIAYGTGLQNRTGSIADRDYFQRHRHYPDAGLVFSKPLLGRITGQWTINVARRLNDRNGSFAGVVYGTIPLASFVGRFSVLNIGRHGGISLRDEEMGIIARYPLRGKMENTVGNKALSPELRQRFESGLPAGAFFTEKSWDSVAKMVSYHRVGSHPLYIVVGVAKTDYLEKWRNDVVQTTGLCVLFSLVTVLMSRLLYLKIRQEEAVRDQLSRSRDELELRVAERTSELQSELTERVRAVAELKHAEQMRRLSERRFGEVLENIRLAAMIVDKHGTVTFCNEFLLQLTGWSREEVLGKDWFDRFMPPELREPRRIIFGRRLSIATGPLHVELPVLTRDGNRRCVDWNLTLLRDADNKVTGIAGIGIDMTDHKSLEEQLRQSQKMEAVGQLAGGVAHDFNNILTVIAGYCGILRMSPDTTPAQLHDIEQIDDAAERAAKLTRSLLAFSRKETMHSEALDLNEVVSRVEKLLLRVIGEDISLKVQLGPNPLVGWVDRAMIEQVLMNLATNARDAMPRGGLLAISTGSIDMDQGYVDAHGYGSPGRYAVICVSDNGLGMDEVTRKKVFEPFFTTKELGKGTGLGMSIVYGIVKQHQGFINLYSEPGQGSTFKIYLPLAESATRPAPPQPEADLAGKGTETILVIEDEAPVQAVVQRVLSRYGYDVIVASDGAEGVELFARNRHKVMLVLMDIIMPKMNGKEAWSRIKAMEPNVKVLFTSGYTADIIESRGEFEDGTEVIMKPVHPRQLLLRVRELLDAPRQPRSGACLGPQSALTAAGALPR